MPSSLLDKMTAAALEAGQVILDVYGTDFSAQEKQDGSPVTVADERAENLIIAALAETGIPLLGEESVAAGKIPDIAQHFFVVDPLDGTKEFIKRNGEFTVNIALVSHGEPVMGVVYAPALGQLFTGDETGAHEFAVVDWQLGEGHAIAVDHSGPMRVVASRSHGHAALAPLCEAFAVTEDVSVGSSLKFCLVAAGKARLYPRFTPTYEWDTAAGQAVLQAAGGAVVALAGDRLGYGKRDENFLNTFFVAADTEDLARKAAAEMRRILARG